MRSDLMAFRNHALDDCLPCWGDINLAFTFVVASDEECRVEPEARQDGQEVICVVQRPIVKGQSNNVVLCAVYNVVSVGD